NFATGYSQIDLAAAKKHNVVITNTPTESLFASTAEAAIALLLSVARRTTKLYGQLVAGKLADYSPIGDMGVAVRGKTTGIIGFGNIGQKVAATMHKGFDNSILYFNRSVEETI